MHVIYDYLDIIFIGLYYRISGIVYHHAYTQTPQKAEKLPPEKKNCRDTQTAEMREKIYVSSLFRRYGSKTQKININNVK